MPAPDTSGLSDQRNLRDSVPLSVWQERTAAACTLPARRWAQRVCSDPGLQLLLVAHHCKLWLLQTLRQPGLQLCVGRGCMGPGAGCSSLLLQRVKVTSVAGLVDACCMALFSQTTLSTRWRSPSLIILSAAMCCLTQKILPNCSGAFNPACTHPFIYSRSRDGCPTASLG